MFLRFFCLMVFQDFDVREFVGTVPATCRTGISPIFSPGICGAADQL